MKQSKEERLDAAWKKYWAIEKVAREKYEAAKAVEKSALKKYQEVMKPAGKEYWAEVARIEKKEAGK